MCERLVLNMYKLNFNVVWLTERERDRERERERERESFAGLGLQSVIAKLYIEGAEMHTQTKIITNTTDIGYAKL